MTIRYKKDDKNIVVLSMDMENRSQNVINEALQDALKNVSARLFSDDDLAGIIITSEKKDFVAGADIDKLFQATDPKEMLEWLEDFKAVLRKLETLGKPLVAAINGSALGGGYEITLACHYRIAVNNPKTKIGLPEVKLGVFPGGGATQRLPRMIGIQNALPILLEGKNFNPESALKLGMIDELADDLPDMMAKAKKWILAHPESKQPWDQPAFKWPGGDNHDPDIAQLWAVVPAMLNQKTRGNYPAAQHILACVYEGGWIDFDIACRVESRYFAHTATGKIAKNMINAFWYQLNAINKGKSRPEGFEKSRVKKVGILGAGMMGSGVAYVTADAGVEVVLKDISIEAAEKGKQYAVKLLEKRLGQGRITPEKQAEVLNRISTTEKADDLKGCDLIIEAVFEDRELKGNVTREAEAQITETAIFASNTSTLPITGLAEQSARPHNFIGLHFFSPVDRMPLVEIILGQKTGKETLARAFDFVQQIRKTPIVVNDSRGFYTSRVFATFPMEGMALLNEGQHPRAIESAGLQAGMPVGPLALTDEVSIALMLHIIEQTQKDFAAEGKQYVAHPGENVVIKMVQALKRSGKADKKGFYEYPQDGKKYLWPELRKHFPPSDRELSQKEMMTRMLFIQALESARCLEENVVISVADANIGSIFGWGFAPFKGGTLQFINDYGVKEFVGKSEALADKYGSRFNPPEILIKMAENKREF
ncbi:MAG: enoyl-CoA hydratase/isomerase family protein [Deltaproteobacteria bacterium]|nr:enoyl-CoA hydratase/isomerase family protein [Deltaproteobacteria bacterium]